MFDEKSLEMINDNFEDSSITSDCCDSKVINIDICSNCREHCTPVYSELACPLCDGPIRVDDDTCMECGTKFI